MHQEQRRFVIGMLAVHGADQRDVVGALRRCGISSDISMPHFPALLNSKGEGNSVPALFAVGNGETQFAAGRGAGQPLQGWLGVEQVHLAGTAVHEEVDHALGAAPETAEAWASDRRSRARRRWRAALNRSCAQQRRQCGAVQAVHHARKEIAACVVCHYVLTSIDKAEFRRVQQSVAVVGHRQPIRAGLARRIRVVLGQSGGPWVTELGDGLAALGHLRRRRTA